MAAAVELVRLLAGQGIECSTAQAVRAQHSHDESWHQGPLPAVVCFPDDAVQAAFVVAACRDLGLPLVPFGTGTGMEGQVIAPDGGVAVSTRRMDRILQVDALAGRARVEAGVTRKQLNLALRDSGWQFTVDPGADASLGGMASTRASGTNSVRYGTMRETVLSVRVVMPDGRLIDTSHPACAGLAALFVGAEGALGLIAELEVRLHPVPEAIAAASSAFSDLQSAIAAAIAIVARGIRVARVELLDAHAMAAVNAALNLVCLRLLRRHCGEDVNFKASAIFTSNDSIVNGAIVLSGALVMWLGSNVPDLVLGVVVAGIAANGGREILREASETARRAEAAETPLKSK